ncbi:hypothetical protein KUTeg_006640 [Tegillarca granosa]|uniref:Arrestin C-terminal-like domain-containing protein n=1 Tax=Tegillarca granosa TaxID=220873 RepID=A0ABQ9FFP5_TEGGR|nr:hypothetical protein KUTeg_006640 [Tegillarca granosa]
MNQKISKVTDLRTIEQTKRCCITSINLRQNSDIVVMLSDVSCLVTVPYQLTGVGGETMFLSKYDYQFILKNVFIPLFGNYPQFIARIELERESYGTNCNCSIEYLNNTDVCNLINDKQVREWKLDYNQFNLKIWIKINLKIISVYPCNLESYLDKLSMVNGIRYLSLCILCNEVWYRYHALIEILEKLSFHNKPTKHIECEGYVTKTRFTHSKFLNSCLDEVNYYLAHGYGQLTYKDKIQGQFKRTTQIFILQMAIEVPMMERLEKFQIIFNNPTATYCAGETVYGYGWVMLKEPIFVETVCMEAVGEAKVEWMTSSDIQASDEEVFNYTTVLPIKGEKDFSDGAMLHPGSHYFPFEFTLPQKLPSSFKGKHGRLRYFVKMTICSAGGPHPARTSKFAVIGSLDLNKEPDAALPVENDTFEAVGSWCCVAGTVTATIKLDRKGFVMKEAIPVYAEIKNLSTRRISSTQVSLIQNVTYYSYRGRFSESTILVTVHKGSIAPRGKQTWQRELLSIPTVPPSHLRGCKIIDLCIKPSGLARKVKLPVDIVIGTIPVQNTDQQKVSYHPLPSIVNESNFPFPFFENLSDQALLSDIKYQQTMLPTAPPWEEDDDIP